MQEDRLDTLERKVAAIELELLYEKRKARERSPSEQSYHAGEINRNLTIMLGIASGQEQDIKATKREVESIKERLGSLETKLNEHSTILNEHTARFDRLETMLTQVLARLPEKP